MYQVPAVDRTEAWNPSGLRSAWIVAVVSSTPRPLKVWISGCFAASAGAIRSDWWMAKRWNFPFGAGSETVIVFDEPAPTSGAFGARPSSPTRPPSSTVNVCGSAIFRSGLAPSCVAAGAPLDASHRSLPVRPATWPLPEADDPAAATRAIATPVATTTVAVRPVHVVDRPRAARSLLNIPLPLPR